MNDMDITLKYFKSIVNPEQYAVVKKYVFGADNEIVFMGYIYDAFGDELEDYENCKVLAVGTNKNRDFEIVIKVDR